MYLANHSLGRPLDQTAVDVQQALDHWYEKMDDAWDDWLAEIQVFRWSIARLIQAPREDCIVPKTSAGQGLRTVLNCYDEKIKVVTTTAEFNAPSSMELPTNGTSMLLIAMAPPPGYTAWIQRHTASASRQQ